MLLWRWAPPRRPTHKLAGKQAQLFPSWRHHTFITDRDGTAILLNADHRHYAVVELAIRDLEDGSRDGPLPSGTFTAIAASTVLATLARNMIFGWPPSARSTGTVVAKSIRRKYIAIPGRLTHRSTNASPSVDTLAVGHQVVRMLRPLEIPVTAKLIERNFWGGPPRPSRPQLDCRRSPSRRPRPRYQRRHATPVLASTTEPKSQTRCLQRADRCIEV